MQMAQVALEQGEREASNRFLEMCIEKFPPYREAYANLFMAHEEAGNKDAAVQVIEKYLAMFPDDDTVAGELKRYQETGEFDLQKSFKVQLR